MQWIFVLKIKCFDILLKRRICTWGIDGKWHVSKIDHILSQKFLLWNLCSSLFFEKPNISDIFGEMGVRTKED